MFNIGFTIGRKSLLGGLLLNKTKEIIVKEKKISNSLFRIPLIRSIAD